MNPINDNAHFWNHLLFASECLESLPSSEAKAGLIAQLDTITEAFADDADPVENYEAYVVLRLAQAIRQALDSAHE